MEKETKKQILITGATGNIGLETIRFLHEKSAYCDIIAGVRNIEKGKSALETYENLQYRLFDFEEANTFDDGLRGIDTLFLLRPPQIAKVEKYFKPLVDKAKESGVKEIVFLSVQGADEMSYIPHAKIEKLVLQSGINYIFIRPSYFMQNLTTTLAKDLSGGEIVLPAGKALFNWVDIENIGEVAAKILADFEAYKNQAIEITGKENLNFQEVVAKINSVLNTKLKYKSTNLFSFFRYKKKQGVETPMIFVMIMLHFFPRFQKPPKISASYESIIGKEPILMDAYILKDKKLADLLKAGAAREG